MRYNHSWCIFKHYVLLLISSFLFLHGFFPCSGGHNKLFEVVDDINEQCKNNNLTAIVDRLVLVVIDALRLDFVTPDNMPYSSKMVKENGCFIPLQVHSPTVTLPRVKSLTTGAIPQFVDIILNIFGTEKLHDSLIHRLVDAKKKIVFYGDITWIRLYPNTFDRYEEISSYFLYDYKEVDDNVTKNVLKELKNDDWDVMILHYPGLDHIGHIEGPFSELIPLKLKEMDEVIKTIHLQSKRWDKKTLIAVTSDHGMKDSGGHGGSTYGEINVPLLLSGIDCDSSSAVQIDIAPTLAVLLGIEIPETAIGSVILSTLKSFELNQLLQIIHCNALILKRHSQFDIFHNYFIEATLKYKKYSESGHLPSGKEALELFEKFIILTKEKLIEASVKQNENKLLFSMILIIFSLKNILSCILLNGDIKESKTIVKIGIEDIFIVVSIISFVFIPYEQLLIALTLLVVIIFSVKSPLFLSLKQQKPNYNLFPFIFGILFYCVSLFSSSFIEEEHQVWYYFWCTQICLFIYSSCGRSFYSFIEFSMMFFAFRFIRKLNQTGDKWAHLPDISHWLLKHENYFYLQGFTILSLILVYVALKRCLVVEEKSFSYLIIITLFISYLLKNFWPRNEFLFLVLYIVLLVTFALLIFKRQVLIGLIVLWNLNSTLLLQPYNIIMLSYCVFCSLMLRKHVKSEIKLGFCHYWLGNVLFFSQGHSNSLANIDIGAGFTGLSNYNSAIVLPQVLFHTYTFPILSNLLALQCSKNQNKVWIINILCRSLALTFTIISLNFQRQHLFVWTVFAPKLIIEIVHSTVLLFEFAMFNLFILLRTRSHKPT